jgi:hypothetical protein
MTFVVKTNVTFPGAQALAQPSRTTAEVAILGMPELLFWARGDTRDASQSKLAFRDLQGALCQGYGTTAVGSGINGAATMKFDGTPTSRLTVPLLLPPTFSVIMLHRLTALAPGSPAVAPLLSDPNYQIATNPMVGLGPTSSGYMNFKMATAGASLSDGTALLALNTNYISWASFDGATLAAALATNHRSPQASATFGSGVSGASQMWIGGGGVFYVFNGEISDMVVLNVPIAETPYATQRDTVLNYLATKSGITLGA